MTAPTLAARNLGWALALGICLGLVYGLRHPTCGMPLSSSAPPPHGYTSASGSAWQTCV